MALFMVWVIIMIRRINGGRPVYFGESYNNIISATDYRGLCSFMNDNFSLNVLNIETVYLLCFSDEFNLVYIAEISRGTTNHSTVDFRSIVKYALLTNTRYIGLVHNHPNGDVRPSNVDIDILEYAKNISNLAISLIVHIVIAGNFYYDICSKRSGEIE